MRIDYKWFIIMFFVLVLVLFIHLKNNGLYILNKITLTEIELINKYTSIDFPKETVIEYFVLDDDINSNFFSYNQYLKATLLVPNEKIDSLFPEDSREYNKDMILDLRREETDENINFGVWAPITVVKWFAKTQRSILITAMEPGDTYTRMYVSVDKLGWKLWPGYETDGDRGQ